MSKLSVSRIFDIGIIAKQKAYKELEPFISWVQDTLDNLSRSLNKQITIADNLDAQTFTVRMRGSTTVLSASLALQKRPIGVLILKQDPISPAVAGFTWALNQSGQTQINVTFASAPIAGVNITILAFFA